MNATLDPPDTETDTVPRTTHNRMAGYFATAKPKLPKTDVERHAVLTDCVMAALLAMQEQLYCGVPELVTEAAKVIVDVEKTRIRHDRNVTGCKPPLQQLDMSALDDRVPVKCRPVGFPAMRSPAAPVMNEDGLSDMIANLEAMLGSQDDDEEDDVAPPVKPMKPAPAFAKSEEQALEWHVEEMRKGLEQVEQREPGTLKVPQNEGELRKLLGAHLNAWKMKAIEIPQGGFWRTVANWMK